LIRQAQILSRINVPEPRFNVQMTSVKALTYGIIAAAILAALAPALGGNGGAGYAEVAQPAALFIAALLALRVSLMYRAGMRRLFISLGVFLALLGLINVTRLVDEVAEALGDSFFRALLGYQLFTYLFLMAAVALTLKITGLQRVDMRGRAALVAVAALAAVIVARSFPTFSEIAGINGEAAAIYLVIRALDVVAMVALAPAIVLFVQTSREQYRESLTFTVVGLGIIASLVLVYVYELLSGDPLFDIAARDFQSGSLLDALYIFGYLSLCVALFAHLRHEDWSLRRLALALGEIPA
jgi:hypothetical protein